MESTRVQYKEYTAEGRREQHVHSNFFAFVGVKVAENVAHYTLDHTYMVYGSSYSYASKSSIPDHTEVVGVDSLVLSP